jgi:TPR repeat protein
MLAANAHVSRIYYMRALVYHQLRQVEFAIEDMEDAIDLDDRPEYRLVAGKWLLAEKQFKLAKAQFKAGLAKAPHDGNLRIALRDCRGAITAQAYAYENEPRGRVEYDRILAKDVEQRLSKSGLPMSDLSQINPILYALFPGLDIVSKAHVIRDKGKIHEAMKLYEKAHALGNVEGAYNLVCRMCCRSLLSTHANCNTTVFHHQGVLFGTCGTHDYAKAFELFEWCAAQPATITKHKIPVTGVVQAYHALGVAFRDGKGVDPDDKRAFSWFIKAANLGHPQAENNVGVCFTDGRGCNVDYEVARRWYHRAAEKGVSVAQLNYADFLVSGTGGARNLEEARKWYEKAAELGQPEAVEALTMLDEQLRGPSKGAEVMNAYTTSSTSSPEMLHVRAEKLWGELDIVRARNSGTLLREKPMQLKVRTLRELLVLLVDTHQHKPSRLLFARFLIWQCNERLDTAEYETPSFVEDANKAVELLELLSSAGDLEAQSLLIKILCDDTLVAPKFDRALYWARRYDRYANTPATSSPDSPTRMVEYVHSVQELATHLEPKQPGKRTMLSRLKTSDASTRTGERDAMSNMLEDIRLRGGAVSPISVHPSVTSDSMQQMQALADAGSKLAKDYVEAQQSWSRAFGALFSNRPAEAIDIVHRIITTCEFAALKAPQHILAILMPAVERALTRDPTNIAAMSCSLSFSMGSGLATVTRLAAGYISLVPREPFLHHKYACFLGFSQDSKHIEIGVRSMARAFELAAPNIPTDWYYDKGTLLRLSGNTNDAIDAYQYYIDHMERCARKIPEAYYCIASLLCNPMAHSSQNAPPHNVLVNIWRYYRLGQRAEQYRLPVIAPVGQLPPKLIVSLYCSNNPLPNTVQTCGFCFDEPASPQRCSRCKAIKYCSRDCQTKHWPEHKPECRAATVAVATQ